MSGPQKTALEHFDTLSANYEASTGGCTRELARYLVGILPPVDSSSKILDNACGNGIVAQELLYRNPDTPLDITCVDGAAAMVDLARHAVTAINPAAALTFDVMPGENLSLPADTFSHSVTNQGILFFKDGLKGAQEIYRTLKPGGTAIVTSWRELGYIDLVHQAQKAARPNDPLFRIPISENWYQGSHLVKTLKDAGFADVELQEKTVYYGADNVQSFAAQLMNLFAMVAQGWSEEENTKFKAAFLEAAEKAVISVERPIPGAPDGKVAQIVGVPMIALVAVAKK